jgi:hypothetical protein
MTNKHVTVTFATDGSSVIEAHNFQGVGCKDATKQLEVVLAGGGNDNKDTKPKPDYFATTGNLNTHHG